MTKGIDWTPNKLDRLRELYLDKADLSYKLIGEQMTKEFGDTFSRSCISGKLSRMRMPLRGPRERAPIHTRQPLTQGKYMVAASADAGSYCLVYAKWL